MNTSAPPTITITEADTPETIQQILNECRVIAVVGLSSNPIRPSYGVSKYMQDHGYRIIPVNPNETDVLGERAYASLQGLPVKPDGRFDKCARPKVDLPHGSLASR